MGKSGRGRGLTGRVLKAARAEQRGQDEEARAIASRVFQIARDVRGKAAFPVKIQAPITAAAELAAPGIVKTYGVQSEGQSVEDAAYDVAAYMTAGFFSMIVEFNPEHFENWRRNMRAAEEGVRADGHEGADGQVEGGTAGEGASPPGDEGGDPWDGESGEGGAGGGDGGPRSPDVAAVDGEDEGAEAASGGGDPADEGGR